MAANHRRGARWVRGHRQDAAGAEQAAALALVFQRDAPKVAAVDVGYFVMPGEAFVEIGVIGLEQLEHATILAQDALEEELRFLSESLPQVVVEIREQARIGRDRLQIA